MEFEWNAEKNAANFDKHSIRFEEAAQIFRGLTLTNIDTRNDYGEIREVSIGQIHDQVYLVVVHTDRGGITRLISARRAKARERERYNEYYQEITR